MLFKLSRNQINELAFKRLLSSQAAAKRSASGEQPLKSTTLPSGLIVTSLQTSSPIARVGVIIRAGSRYEPPDQLGLTHTLRSMAGFTTQNSTVFGITRNIEYVGGSLSALTTRDNMLYILENLNEFTDNNIKYLSETIMKPAFKPWQIKDNIDRQKYDLCLLKDSPQLILSEALHSVAFKGGLRNSLFSPEFKIGKHSTEALLDFVGNHYVSNRSAIVGLGIDHEVLLGYAEKYFSMARGDRGQTGESKYIGGQTRIDANFEKTYVAVAAEGVGTKNTKDVLALSLLQTILGTGEQSDYSHPTDTKLGEAVSKVAKQQFAVSAFNINHSDTGLFGINVAASPKEIGLAIKAAVTQLRESAKNVSDSDLQKAKLKLKTSTLCATEDQNILLEEIATQSITSGQVISLNDYEKAVDSITAADISSLASKLVKSKGAMASVGKLENVPFLEDLA